MKLFAPGSHRLSMQSWEGPDTVLSIQDTVGNDLDITSALLELKSLVGETDARQMQIKRVVT